MDRWLVIANCQTVGLANSLSLMNPKVHVESCDVSVFIKDIPKWAEDIRNFDKVFVIDQIVNMGWLDFSVYQNVIVIPVMEFHGYHPDICYITTGSGSNVSYVESPLSHYNSLICFSGFKKGLREEEILALYNVEIFERSGYFRLWHEEKQSFLQRSRELGYDFSAAFRRWSLRGSFMYSVNHPKIECLYDIAMAATVKAGREPVDCAMRPHDNLIAGPIFPIYPAIAERYSIEGSYYFKIGGYYRLIDLTEFVARSFDTYRRIGADNLEPALPYKTQYDAVYAAI